MEEKYRTPTKRSERRLDDNDEDDTAFPLSLPDHRKMLDEKISEEEHDLELLKL